MIGWDRTAQLSSLAMMMLDPYFRHHRGLSGAFIGEGVAELRTQVCTDFLGHMDDKMSNAADDQRSPVWCLAGHLRLETCGKRLERERDQRERLEREIREA